MAGPQVSHVSKEFDEAGEKLRGKRLFCAVSEHCLHLLKHAGGLQKSTTTKNCTVHLLTTESRQCTKNVKAM
jgi:hypothetical protein